MEMIDYHRHTLRLEDLPPAQRAQEIARFTGRIRVFDYVTPGEEVAPHGGGLSIKLVVRGAERFILAGGEVQVGAGEALVVPAGMEYGSRITRSTETFSAFFPPAFCRRLAQDALGVDALDRLPPLPICGGAGLAAGLAGARHALQGQDWARAEEILQEAALRLVATDHELRDAEARLPQQRPAARRELLRRLQRCRSYLHDHVTSTVSLDQLAAIAQLSRFHLLRGFRAAFGCTPSQYHGGLRLDLARRRLRAQPGQAVADVARAVGYASHSAFSRAWRRRFGDTPAARPAR